MLRSLPEPNLNPLTSSAEATPASHFPKPENAEESQTRGIFGQSSPDFFAYFDPDTYFWRTSQATFHSVSDLFSETWPDSGTMRNGRVYALRTSARVTSGNGCSSLDTWPTHTQQNGTQGTTGTHGTTLIEAINRWPSPRSEDSESAGNHPGAVDLLTGATRNWATPDCQDTHHGTRSPSEARVSKRIAAGRQISLEEQAACLWQIPATDSFRSRGGHRVNEMGLDQQARMFETWPTPRVMTGGSISSQAQLDRIRSGEEPERGAGACKLEISAELFHPSPPAPQIRDGQPSSESAPGLRRLSPAFVEWLLGLPLFWTEIP